MQHLIFWFFNKYGFYFYIEKFKIVNNKILLQLYYYKTYLYNRKSYKTRTGRAEGSLGLSYPNPVIPLAKQGKFTSFAILSKKYKLKSYRLVHRRAFSKKVRRVFVQREMRLFFKNVNLFSLISEVDSLSNTVIKSDLSRKMMHFVSKIYLYFESIPVLNNSYIFLNVNYLQFLLMKRDSTEYFSALYNHLYDYFFPVLGNYKISKNIFWRSSLLSKIQVVKDYKEAGYLTKIQELEDKKKEMHSGLPRDLSEKSLSVSVLDNKKLSNLSNVPLLPTMYNWQYKNKWHKKSFSRRFRRFNKRNYHAKNIILSPETLRRYKQFQVIKKSFTFNFFFTYYFAFFFHCQTHLLYKSLYKYMFNHITLRQEYNIICQRAKYLRRRNLWAFDFLFFMHYSVTFGNTLFLWPFLVYHLKRTFKRHGATMQLIINVIRTIFFLKPYFKGFKIMIKGPFDRHGRSRKLLLHLGHMGFTKYMQHPIMYDMIHCPIVYGMCSIKFWMAYE